MLAELRGGELAREPDEFPPAASEWPDELSRRTFLRLMGASLAFAGAGACTRQPPEQIVSYVRQPETMTLGKPLWFARAMELGGAARGLLVRSHEGRPTKMHMREQILDDSVQSPSWRRDLRLKSERTACFADRRRS
jgi:MoCo/4Fe-4S cofactor protein with predicted Tat translocation signal